MADDLSQRFQLASSQVELPGRSLKLIHPRNADALIDEADFNRDERLPYWAEIWPAARALMTPSPAETARMARSRSSSMESFSK